MINSCTPVVVALPLAMSWAVFAGPPSGSTSTTPGGEVPVVAVSAPDPPLVPPAGLPGGLRVEEVSVPEVVAPRSPAELLVPDAAAQTLYRDESGQRVLVVARTESSDTGGGFAAVGGEEVALADGRAAALDESGPLTVVGWDESDADECDVCYQTGVVAARGLTTDEVLAAASGALVQQPTPIVAPEALPAGLEPVSVVPLLDPFENLRFVAERLVLSDAYGNGAMVFVYGGGDALAEHLSFWVVDGTHLGAAYGADAVVTTVGDDAVLAVSFGVEAADIAALVDALQPGDVDDVAAVVEDVQQAPVTPADDCLPGDSVAEHTAVLGGTTTDGARWVAGFGLQPDDGDVMTCTTLVVDGERFGGGSSIGGPFEPPADPATIDLQVTGVSGPERGWWLARGAVAAQAERVRVTFTGVADPVDAQLADVGPAEGWSWFAIAVPATSESRPAVRATAYDASGEEVATGATD